MSKNKIVKILVLDANQRSALAVIRSLGSLSSTQVYTADSVKKAIGGSSKSSDQYIQHPSITKQPLEFIQWLEQVLDTENIEILFPCTEISSQLILMHNSILNQVKLPFASLQTVMNLANKVNLTKLAEKINIPYPKSQYFNDSSEVTISEIKKFPIVVKPCLSQLWKKDHWESTEVLIASNSNELSEILNSTSWLQNDEFMLQEFVSGFGAGIFAIYDNGNPIAFFSHERIREKPPQGGVSVLSRSKPLDPKLLHSATKLLDAVSWHGVAMVEYRVDSDGTPYLMEVNTRFWGSLQLAIDSGVDFPKLLFNITQGIPVAPINEYDENKKLRWFLGDLDSLYMVLRSKRFTLKDKLKRTLQFIIPDIFNTHHQVDRWGDFGPAITELTQYIKDLRN